MSPLSVGWQAARATRTLGWLALLLALTSPTLAGTPPTPPRCTTYEEQTLGRLQTLCDDGTRAISRYNALLERWETTITTSPRRPCTASMHPWTRQVEVRCH